MNTVIDLLASYGYLVLFFGVVVEGELFPLAAGALVSYGFMNLYTAIGVTFVGSFMGDVLWFWAARRWGRWLVDRFGCFRWFRRKRLVGLEEHFRTNGKKTLFLTKFIYSFGHSSIVVAGLAGMPPQELYKVSAPASLLWAVLFVLLGHFFGSSFNLLNHTLRDVAWAGAIIFAAMLTLHLFARRRLIRRV